VVDILKFWRFSARAAGERKTQTPGFPIKSAPATAVNRSWNTIGWPESQKDGDKKIQELSFCPHFFCLSLDFGL
jgi:hypothetical protein